jgi:hypothetical protein
VRRRRRSVRRIVARKSRAVVTAKTRWTFALRCVREIGLVNSCVPTPRLLCDGKREKKTNSKQPEDSSGAPSCAHQRPMPHRVPDMPGYDSAFVHVSPVRIGSELTVDKGSEDEGGSEDACREEERRRCEEEGGGASWRCYWGGHGICALRWRGREGEEWVDSMRASRAREWR